MAQKLLTINGQLLMIDGQLVTYIAGAVDTDFTVTLPSGDATTMCTTQANTGIWICSANVPSETISIYDYIPAGASIVALSYAGTDLLTTNYTNPTTIPVIGQINAVSYNKTNFTILITRFNSYQTNVTSDESGTTVKYLATTALFSVSYA